MGLTNDQVIDRWIDRNEGNGPRRRDSAGSGSVRYSGPVLYSYGTPIARYYKDYVLVNANKYGVTTARHINRASGWVNFETLRVPCIDSAGGESWHWNNVTHLHAKLGSAINEAVRLFKHRYANDGDYTGEMPYYLRDPIANAHTAVCEYARRVLKKQPDVDPLETILKEVRRQRDAKWTAYMEPTAVARRERVAARKLAKEALIGEM